MTEIASSFGWVKWTSSIGANAWCLGIQKGPQYELWVNKTGPTLGEGEVDACGTPVGRPHLSRSPTKVIRLFTSLGSLGVGGRNPMWSPHMVEIYVTGTIYGKGKRLLEPRRSFRPGPERWQPKEPKRSRALYEKYKKEAEKEAAAAGASNNQKVGTKKKQIIHRQRKSQH